MVVPSTCKVETGEPEVQGHSWLQSELKVSLGYISMCLKKKKISPSGVLGRIWTQVHAISISTEASLTCTFLTYMSPVVNICH